MEINSVVRIGYPFGYIDNDSLFVKGETIYLYDQNGKQYLDLCSGLWNMPFGYSNILIKEKVINQLSELTFVNLIQSQAEIQLTYARRLCNYLGGYKSILYTNSGSEAIEAAIKTCRKYQVIKGNAHCKSISAFIGSYHGTTYGAMSVSGIDRKFAQDYHPMLPQINWIRIPEDIENVRQWLEILEDHFEQHHHDMAGIIAEPIMASGGLIKIPAKVLRTLTRLCQDFNKLLVIDEVATGFGRTGRPFAFQEAEIEPDLICLAKAMNNGYLPIGALAFSQKTAVAFAEANESLEHFSTQGGNLLAIAAADAVLDLMQDLVAYRIIDKGNFMLAELKNRLDGLNVDIRGFGLMIGIEFRSGVNSEKLQEILDRLKKLGLLVYAFHNPGLNIGISIFPPYIISEEQITNAAKQLARVLKRIL